MIWDECDQQAMRRIYGQVWISIRIALRWPCRLTTPGYTSRALGRRWQKPVIRSWLGVGSPTPLTVWTPDLTTVWI